MKVCALTGHRALPPDFDENGLSDALEELIREGVDTFLCGMAEGFDLLSLSLLVRLREKYRIRLEAWIPFAGQERTFSAKNKELYRTLLCWCDAKNVLYPGYRNGCFLARDRCMVRSADMVFAYCTRDTGGAAYTVKFAQENNIPLRFYQ